MTRWLDRPGPVALVSAAATITVALIALVGTVLVKTDYIYVGTGPQPTVTVTVPVAPPPTPAPTPVPPPASDSGGSAYRFELPAGHWATLGLTAPTQSDIMNASTGDLNWRSDLGGPNLYTAPPQDELVLLDPGVPPSREACTTSNSFPPGNAVAPIQGRVICILEGTGLVAGVTIAKVKTGEVFSLTLDVRVWRRSP